MSTSANRQPLLVLFIYQDASVRTVETAKVLAVVKANCHLLHIFYW